MYPGDMAKPDSPMFTIMDLSIAVARTQVPESDAAGVRVGQRCIFTSTDDGEKRWEGRISVLNQAVDPAHRTVKAWCELPNPNGTLRAGVFGSVLILTGVQVKSVVVPLAAVQFREDGESIGDMGGLGRLTAATRDIPSQNRW